MEITSHPIIVSTKEDLNDETLNKIVDLIYEHEETLTSSIETLVHQKFGVQVKVTIKDI